MQHCLFCGLKHHIEPFGLGGAMKPGEENNDQINELMNYNCVWRAATGFARVGFARVGRIYVFICCVLRALNYTTITYWTHYSWVSFYLVSYSGSPPLKNMRVVFDGSFAYHVFCILFYFPFWLFHLTNVIFSYTRRYGPLRGPTGEGFSLCFFGPPTKIRAIQEVSAHFSIFCVCVK